MTHVPWSRSVDYLTDRTREYRLRPKTEAVLHLVLGCLKCRGQRKLKREISILHFELQMETMEKKRILGKDPENLCVTLQTQKFSHLDSELVFQMALSKRDSTLYLTYEMQSVIINVSRGEFSWWSFKFASQLARIDDSCSEVKSKGIFSFSWSLHQEPVNYSPWAKIPSTTCFCK